ncbi:tyrosine-type recombinase/integrase [Synechococcus sp. PCC 6312]|uniref:tyrosine-type recombinase/integrase n=1 Tax=Synechococcus sp. (strain ATCC 27167 / PCC 6312) TaxID=195253 RepID=UPI00029ED780|nr:tyrosine-type recombinase/integrase [Synechococcus sp. PCC 6312]AFY61802.1 site-specific recombinase XerD [Synechococcus sp. PCC 6312]
MFKVTIEKHGSRLQLRWQYLEKRYTLAVGMPDSVVGRSKAKQIAGRIEQDMATGHFDPTLLAYKPRKLGKTRTELSCPELFQAFTQAMSKEKGLSPGSLCRYQGVLAHLKRSLNIEAHAVSQQRAGNLTAVLMEQVCDRTTKEYLWLLESCWTWAKGKYHIGESNPWAGLASKIKASPRQKVKPFTEAEVKTILAAFKTNRYYSHYFEMICFLFGTGARLGEVAALRWKHLSSDFSLAWIGETISRGNHRKSTKTGKSREVILSPGLVAMLQSLHEKRKPKPDDLIFPSPKGKPMDDKNFRRRAWSTILKRLDIPYRKPYFSQHSVISHALANGASPLGVASQSGHDPRILFQNYASTIRNQSVFVEF